MTHGDEGLTKLLTDVVVHGALSGIVAGLVFCACGPGSLVVSAQANTVSSLLAFLFVCAEVGVAAALPIAIACDGSEGSSLE